MINFIFHFWVFPILCESSGYVPSFHVEHVCEVEGQIENTSQDNHIECPDGERIKIKDAIFGRIDGGSQCGGNEKCLKSLDLTDQARKRCDGHHDCYFSGTINDEDVPCPGISKYTRIRYLCIRMNGTICESTYYSTSARYDYMEHGAILTGSEWKSNPVKFSVVAKNDIHISLSKDSTIQTNGPDPNWEIVLGGWGGHQSVMRKKHQGTNLVRRTHSYSQYVEWREDFELRVTSSSIGLYDRDGLTIMELPEFSDELEYLFISGWGSASGEWTVNHCQSDIDTDFAIQEQHLYQTIPQLYADWHLTLDVMPTGVVDEMANILFVADENGNPTPGIWFLENSTSLHIAVGNLQERETAPAIPALPMNEWTRIEVFQFNGTYQVRTGGKLRYELKTSLPTNFENVQIFTGYNQYAGRNANARIDNLVMDTWENDTSSLSMTPQCYVEVENSMNGSPETIINYPELMEHVRIQVELSHNIDHYLQNTEYRIHLTEFDDENIFEGQHWEIRFGSPGNDRVQATIHKDGVQLTAIEHSQGFKWLDHIYLKMTDTAIELTSHIGEVIIRYESFDSEKIHYLSVGTSGTDGSLKVKWEISDESCPLIPLIPGLYCRDGWHPFQNKCVKIFGKITGLYKFEEGFWYNWHDASEYCLHEQNAVLARVDNIDMNSFIASLSNDNTWLGVRASYRRPYPYIDVFENEIAFSYWATGQPDTHIDEPYDAISSCAANGHGSRERWGDYHCEGTQDVPNFACMEDGWDPVNHDRGFHPKPGLILQRLPIINRQFHLTFEFMPLSLQSKSDNNVILRGIDNRSLEYHAYLDSIGYEYIWWKGQIEHNRWTGFTIPEIVLTRDNALAIRYPLNGRNIYGSYIILGESQGLVWPTRKWVKVEIAQIKQANGDYLFTATVNGTVLHKEVNYGAKKFKDVSFEAIPDYDHFERQWLSNVKIDNFKIDTWPDSVNIKSAYTKRLGGCKSEIDSNSEHAAMLCKTDCPSANNAWDTKFKWVLNTKQTLIGQVKLLHKIVPEGENYPEVGLIRFERDTCSHELLQEIENHGAVRFEVSDLRTGNHWVESITYLHDIGEKWARTALYAQFRRGAEETIEAFFGSEKQNVLYISFHVSDTSRFSSTLLQKCLSSAHVSGVRYEQTEPFTNDYTRCAAFSKYRLEKDWTETDFVPNLVYIGEKPDPLIGGCKPDVTFGRENGNMQCWETCDVHQVGAGAELNMKWQMKTETLMITEITQTNMVFNSLLGVTHDPHGEPYIGLIRLEKSSCGHALLVEIEKRGAVRFDVGDRTKIAELNTPFAQDDKIKYRLESITYPYGVNEEQSALFIQFLRTQSDIHEIMTAQKDKFYAIMSVSEEDKLSQLGIKLIDIEQCLENAHLSVMKVVQDYDNGYVGPNHIFEHDYTRCVAYDYYNLPTDWNNNTFIFQDTVTPRMLTVPIVPE